MRYLRGRLEDGRIRIPVGIRAFRPSDPVGRISTAIELNYRQYTALVDTGARRTCVTERVVHDLSLRRRGRVEIWNIKRPEQHWTYLFHLGIWPEASDGVPSAIFGIGNEIEGIDVGNNHFFDVLIGMDVISQGSLHLEQDGTFEMAFPG